MTISLARRKKLAAIAKAHEEWVDKHLADVSPAFDPAAYPKPDSDYNQHNLDVDASGEAEDELAAMLADVLGEPMTAAGDPDWDPAEHPRGPDGKFIEDGSSEIIAHLKKKISETSVAKSIAYMNDDHYKGLALHEEQVKLEKQLADFEASSKITPPLPSVSKSKSAPAGKPITAWTKAIYSDKYADGEIVAVKGVSERLMWDEDEKKFIWQKASPTGTGWTKSVYLTKKDAYNYFKNEKKSWQKPASGAAAVDDAPPPVGLPPAPASKAQTPEIAAVLSGDFSGLKQVGAQGGSTQGGFFEAADGSRWYVKSQKSEKHAKNEALAAAFYNAAGVEVPAVIRGKGTPGLSGQNHTATRIIEGANPNLKQKLNDPDYLAKIREGFAVDAWLANWDAVGLTFDNIVEDAHGNPERIDVGGSLVFRAMGDEKGSLFGPKVGELETLRNPQMAPTASKVFGGISDDELSVSAAKVAGISPEQIKKLVADYGMESSVADVLIARREDILTKIPITPKVSAKATSPAFTILPASKRGKSGDGHFAPKIWGKYGAAGVMMRHVDDDGIERFLLVKANTANSKRWQLPGGALEELETPEQGAAREVHEELGFTQDFLHNMTPIGTHKVTIDVPDKGQWHYSNIAVDVPNAPDLTWDKGELGGAQWFTKQQLAVMSADDEIHPALKANLSEILGKFDVKKVEAPAPAPAPTALPPAISNQSTEKKTTWTKSKFNSTTVYKTSYDNNEIVGFTKFGSVLAGGDAARIIWSNGKFTRQKWSGSDWQFDGAYMTKKEALSAMKDQPFYKPPKGTMSYDNNDSLTGTSMIAGNSTITITGNESLSAGITTPPESLINLTPFNSNGQPFGVFKSSFKAFSTANNEHIGAVHETHNGTWEVATSSGTSTGKYLSSSAGYKSKEEATAALSLAYKAMLANKSGVPAPVSAPATKKTPKLSAAQIEKQNGTIPKTLKSTQKSVFLKNLKENSPYGFIKSSDTDAKKVFSALVHAVNAHNDTQSPKLNYLQGLNVLDTVYGSTQKASVVAWLQTSEGKALAPGIVNGLKLGEGQVIPAPSSGVMGMQAAYSIGTPKKNVDPGDFAHLAKYEASEMHQQMYKKTPLDPDSKAAIKDYMGSSQDFNEPLRGNDTMTPGKAKYIARLQAAMRPVTRSFVVWRGTDGLGSAINSKTIKNLDDLRKFEGAVVGDPAFMSTSILESGSFSGKKFKLIVNVPEGTPATYAFASGSGAFANEQEMLLAAGLHYKIDRVSSPSTGTYYIYMTVVPEVKKK